MRNSENVEIHLWGKIVKVSLILLDWQNIQLLDFQDMLYDKKSC